MVNEKQAIERVKKLASDLDVNKTSFSSEGQSNYILIVNDEWVFRFARSEAAGKDLAREAAVLKVLRDYIDATVPESDQLEEGIMRQRKVHGEPLDRHTLLRQPTDVQDRLFEELAHFLFQIHRVPEDKLRGAGVGKSPAGEGNSDAQTLYHDCERELFPHLKSYAIDVIKEHFEPVLHDTLSVDAPAVLIHGDLNPSHILWDPQRGRLAGLIDFGMAGFADSALDYAHMLLSYGETILRRMYQHHRSIGEKIDRARFWALAIELKLTLSGLRSGDPRWFCAHLGTARDILPVGSVWE
jgi:aminoglycoside 2''-phosphotransferase